MTVQLKQTGSSAGITGSASRRRVLGMLAATAAAPLLPSLAKAQSGKSVMRIASVLTDQDNVHRAMVRFKESVEKKTNGQIEVQIYPNSALGSLRVTFESMQLGNLEAGLWDAGTPANVVPMWTVPELPYILRDLAHVHKVVDGPIGQEMSKVLLDKAKIRTLAVYDTTFRKIFTRPRAINNMADMKGMKIRVPEVQAYVRCMQLLGANPTPIPWGELYTSLETGVVQGFENKCEAAFNAKLHEQTKFAAYTGHIFVVNPLMVSDRWFSALSKGNQQVVLDAAKESLAWQRAEAPASEKIFEQKMKDAGVTFTSPDPAPFRKAVEPYYKEFGDKYGVNELIKRVRDS
ncbi:MAG: TRAP transporter substrate-binding protein [Betaproteobacteria bacterium]|nr:TRAP transporter substrate-binding protein [Betaproteobacteria bacterium]